MKTHEKSDAHSQAKNLALSEAATLSKGSVVQLQKVDKQERMKNQAAVKSLLRCMHFLVRNHIAHTTNFEKLVDLVVSCGGEALTHFMDKAAQNAVYTSHVAVVEFVEAGFGDMG